jgi:hypothetical protein
LLFEGVAGTTTSVSVPPPPEGLLAGASSLSLPQPAISADPANKHRIFFIIIIRYYV